MEMFITDTVWLKSCYRYVTTQSICSAVDAAHPTLRQVMHFGAFYSVTKTHYERKHTSSTLSLRC